MTKYNYKWQIYHQLLCWGQDMVQNKYPYRQDNHIIRNVDLFASLDNRYTCYTKVNDNSKFECIDSADSTDTPYFTVGYQQLKEETFFAVD